MWCFGKLAYQVYAKPRPESIRSLNAKDCAEIAADLKYIWKISDVRYGLNVEDITKSNDLIAGVYAGHKY